MGIPIMMNAPLADITGNLSGSDRRATLRTIQALHQRFPQLSFAAVLMDVPPDITPALQAFWVFNRCSLFSAVERAGDNHGVLLLLDTTHNRAVCMIGYGLEPLVSEVVLEVCLTAASASLVKSQYAAAIQAFLRELERQFNEILAQLPRTFGYSENAIWVDPTSTQEDISAPSASQIQDLY